MNPNLEYLKEVLARARREVAKVIIGQEEVTDKALIAIFTGQHALIEGVPGTAKTLLVRTLRQGQIGLIVARPRAVRDRCVRRSQLSQRHLRPPLGQQPLDRVGRRELLMMRSNRVII